MIKENIELIVYNGFNALVDKLSEGKLLKKKKNIKKFFKNNLLFWTDLEFSEVNKIMKKIGYKPEKYICKNSNVKDEYYDYRFEISDTTNELSARVFYYTSHGISLFSELGEKKKNVFFFFSEEDKRENISLIKLNYIPDDKGGIIYKMCKDNAKKLLDYFRNNNFNFLFTNSDKSLLFFTGKFTLDCKKRTNPLAYMI